MPAHIDDLTQAQRDAIPAYRDAWIAKGLQTGETDWETFDRFMPICYQKIGVPYPTRVVRVSSPLVGAFAASIADLLLQKPLSNNVLAGTVRGAVGGVVREAVVEAVGQALREAVGGAVDEAVCEAVGDAVKNRKNLVWHPWLGGQFWVGGWYWNVAFVNFFFDVCHLTLSSDLMERALAYRKVCESVNYIWPNRQFVMVCARPSLIARNTRGQLHNPHGYAIRYPDGWGLYYLNGVSFPDDVYHRVISGSMRMEEILALPNIDQRTQAIRWAKDGMREFYHVHHGTCLSSYEKRDGAGRTIRYELWHLPSGELFTKPVAFMLYDCPSAAARGEQKTYSKGVPVECATVAEAMAWGMSSETETVRPEEWELLEPLVTES